MATAVVAAEELSTVVVTVDDDDGDDDEDKDEVDELRIISTGSCSTLPVGFTLEKRLGILAVTRVRCSKTPGIESRMRLARFGNFTSQ